MTINLRYVALSPLHIQKMVSEGVPLLDERGQYVFTDYKTGDEVPAETWGQRVISRMVEYRRLLPVATDSSATVDVPRTGSAYKGEVERVVTEPSPPAQAVTSYAEDLRMPEVREFPYHYGGPWYELSDGSRVKGKTAADAGQAILTGGDVE